MPDKEGTFQKSATPGLSNREPSLLRRSVNNREMSLTICEYAWQPPDRNSRRKTFRGSEFSSIVKKLPSEGPTFGPARSFRPDQQHLSIHARRDGRMVSRITIARRSDRRRRLDRNGVNRIEVNLACGLPRGEHSLSAFA